MTTTKSNRRRTSAKLSPENAKKIREVLTLLTGKPYKDADHTNIKETFFQLGWIGPEERRHLRQRGYLK